LNNFSSLFAVYCAMTSNPIHRLTRTRSLLSEACRIQLLSWKELFSSKHNSRQLRIRLLESTAPAVPHLGLVLSDLTFINDTTSVMQNESLLNCSKFEKITLKVQTILHFQQFSYTQLCQNPAVQESIRTQMKKLNSEDLWNTSLQLEA